jgi:hypothetical protein
MTNEEARRLVFYLDGLRYSFAMTELAAKRVTSTLSELTRTHLAKEPTEPLAMEALLDAWSIVDMCHRIRELVQQVPGLSSKKPEIQIFLRATEAVEELRHYVQHFRNEIPVIPSNCSPLWGSLSWVPENEPNACYTLFTGNFIDGVNVSTITFDRLEGRYLSKFRLFAGNAGADLLDIADRVEKLRKSILEWLDHLPGVKREAAVHSPIFRLALVPVVSTTLG